MILAAQQHFQVTCRHVCYLGRFFVVLLVFVAVDFGLLWECYACLSHANSEYFFPKTWEQF